MGINLLTGEVEDDVASPILYNGGAEAYLVVDRPLTKYQGTAFVKAMKSFLGTDAITVINPFSRSIVDDKQVLRGVLSAGIEIEKYIPPYSKVLTFGRGNHAITHDTTITISTFQDTVFGRTSYFAPKLQSRVWPTHPLDAIFPKESYNVTAIPQSSVREHLVYQTRLLRTSTITKGRTIRPKIVVVEDPSGFFREHDREEVVAWDIETSGFHIVDNEVICITMSFDGKTGYYLDWKSIDPIELNTFFEGKKQIGANLKFDCRFLHYRGITNAMPYFDTLHAGHVLNEMRSNSLKTHAWLYTRYGGYDEPLEEFKRKHTGIKSYDQIPRGVLQSYATMDAIVTYLIYAEMERELKEYPKLHSYFWEHVMPSVRLFVGIESEGVYIDWANVVAQEKELAEIVAGIEQRIYQLAGKKFHISGDEKSIVLEQMGLPCYGRQEHKPIYAVNDDTLSKWASDGYEIAIELKRWSQYSKLASAFVGSEQLWRNDPNKNNAYWMYRSSTKWKESRLFPSYSVMLAKSHRNRMQSPNFQQVPHHGDDAWRIRSFFNPPSSDFVLSEFDYSGLQLRIAAIIADDQVMLSAFREGQDLHSVTAQQVFAPNVSIEDFLAKKKEEPYTTWRYVGKQLNFTLLFGGGAMTFADRSIRPTWSEDQCRGFIEERGLEVVFNQRTKERDVWLTVAAFLREQFFRTYKGLARWHETTEVRAKRQGYIESVYGARRLLPQLPYAGTDEKKLANDLKNIALNSPVQNFEIVIVHRAMRNLSEFFRKNKMQSRIWGTTHDSVSFYLHRDEIDVAWEEIPLIMSRPYPEYKGVTFEVEGGIADFYANPPLYWGYGCSLAEYRDARKRNGYRN